jgi:hypothetical protein
MEHALDKNNRGQQRDNSKPKPISFWGIILEIIGTKMRDYDREDTRPDEMCKIKIHGDEYRRNLKKHKKVFQNLPIH